MVRLGYDWTKDVQKQAEVAPFNPLNSEAPGFDILGPLAEIYNDPGRMTELLLQNPNIQASLQAGQDAADAARSAATAGLGAARKALADARAAAAKQRDIQRKQLQFKLDTGLRDIEQGRESGIQGAINNALQRGIYRSGIRIENEEEVNRESDEAASDLQTSIDLALEMLQAQAAGQEAGFASQAAGLQQRAAAGRAQQLAAQQFITLDDIAQIATQFQFDPIGTQSPLPQPPTITSPQDIVDFQYEDPSDMKNIQNFTSPLKPKSPAYTGGVQ